MDTLRHDLHRLASNHLWTWQYRSADLLGSLPTSDPDQHPVVAVRDLTEDQLAVLAADDAFMAELTERLAHLDATMATAIDDPSVVYYSPEFGISAVVPQYSGGLGILAGDHLKSASDLGTNLGAVGLFYRHGFFRQYLDGDQQAERVETYWANDFGCTDTGIVVEVPIADRTVRARVWRMQVGRIALLLLDTDIVENPARDRAITDQLYGGDRLHRLEQELVLGVGGARAVEAVGWRPAVHHSNEGHAGFLTIELIDRARVSGADLHSAIATVTPSVLFTTHTPVPAGIDRFDRDLIVPHLQPWAERWGDGLDGLLALGAESSDDPEQGPMFNMAALCLRVAAQANGVSKLHGEVSRDLFADVPGGSAIGSVTNGVHARTWVSPNLQDLFDAELGPSWDLGDPAAWSRIDDVDGAAIVAARAADRTKLADLLTTHGATLDPDAVVIGFARRFATYKRADLLLRHADRLAALLADDDRPVHILFAGKAHPADSAGKALLTEIVRFGTTTAANGRFTFIPDYDIEVARALYFGCDVWLNNPVRPREASGTSGEKAALNGALNCSILDGWWAEMSDGRNGWDIPTSDAVDDVVRDAAESASALTLLAEIAAEYHADATGRPSRAWLDRMRHNWRTLGPQVTAARMVADYDRTLYQPLIDAQR